jgi:hypothetical protein
MSRRTAEKARGLLVASAIDASSAISGRSILQLDIAGYEVTMLCRKPHQAVEGHARQEALANSRRRSWPSFL